MIIIRRYFNQTDYEITPENLPVLESLGGNDDIEDEKSNSNTDQAEKSCNPYDYKNITAANNLKKYRKNGYYDFYKEDHLPPCRETFCKWAEKGEILSNIICTSVIVLTVVNVILMLLLDMSFWNTTSMFLRLLSALLLLIGTTYMQKNNGRIMLIAFSFLEVLVSVAMLLTCEKQNYLTGSANSSGISFTAIIYCFNIAYSLLIAIILWKSVKIKAYLNKL